MPRKKKQKVVAQAGVPAAGGAAPTNSNSRAQLTPLQRSTLEAAFELERLPDAATRARLAETLDLSSRQIQVWFQNRRQRQREAGPEGEDGAGTLTTRHDGELSMCAPNSHFPPELTELLALMCTVTGFAVAELWVLLDDEPAADDAGVSGAAQQQPPQPPQLVCDRIFVTSPLSADGRLVTGVGALSRQHAFSTDLCNAVLGTAIA
jgi:hypothetical protein